MRILGIESSCDETAASIVEDGERLLSNVVNSQIDIHAEYGGVIPEIAARSHLEVVNPVIKKALSDAGFEHQKNYWVPEFGWIKPLQQEELKDNLKVGTVKRRGN